MSGVTARSRNALDRRDLAAIALLALLSLPLIAFRLGSYSLVNGDEAIYHAMAEHMVESGNWLRLEFLGEERVYDTFMNAPLQYWARGLLIALFGSNLWTVRLLSALFGLASVAMTFGLVRSFAGRRAAFMAALVQVTTYQFIFLHAARTGELETSVCFVLTLAALLFWRGVEREASFLPHHICLAALVGLKAPLVLVPLMAEIAFFALDRSSRPRLRSWLATGLLVAPFSLAWHLSHMLASWDAFVAVASQMASEATAPSGSAARTGWLRYYGTRLVFGAFPVVLVYPLALAELAGERDDRQRRQLQLVALYGLAVFAFCLAVAKRGPWYFIPAYPFLSALVGVWLAGVARRPSGTPLLAGLAVASALAIWLDVDLRMNPFGSPAYRIPMEVGWRHLGSLAPALGVPATALLAFCGLLALRARVGVGFSPVLAVGLAVALVGTAAVRAGFGLTYTDHESELARLRRELDAAEAAGLPVAFPIALPRGQEWIARYTFGRDYTLARYVEPRGSGEEGWRLVVVGRGAGQRLSRP